jgi:ParB family chromosome partitioning protein
LREVAPTARSRQGITSILLSASRGNAGKVLQDAAAIYKMDTDAIALKVKQEFAAKS